MKYPEKGKVKRRLAREIGREKALCLFQKLVRHTLGIVSDFKMVHRDVDTFLFYYPPEKNAEIRAKVIISTLAFVCGFSVVFILMGASASFLGGLIYEYKDIIRIVGGIIIIILGIHLTGILRIKALDFEKKIHIKKKPLHFLGTFFIGMAFGTGWSPCVGPLLGSILFIAGSQDTVWHGVVLLGIYSAGLAVPFILMSVFINFLLVFIKKATRVIKYINPAAGILLILVGIFLIINKFYGFAGL